MINNVFSSASHSGKKVGKMEWGCVSHINAGLATKKTGAFLNQVRTPRTNIFETITASLFLESQKQKTFLINVRLVL